MADERTAGHALPHRGPAPRPAPVSCGGSPAARSASCARRSWRLFLLGQAYLAILLALPALGRWPLGLNQSFALRYHSQLLLGLLIALLPAALRYWGRPLAALGLVWLTVQGVMGFEMDYFASRGREVRRVINEASAGAEGDLAPEGPDPITPGMKLDHLRLILSTLGGV